MEGVEHAEGLWLRGWRLRTCLGGGQGPPAPARRPRSTQYRLHICGAAAGRNQQNPPPPREKK